MKMKNTTTLKISAIALVCMLSACGKIGGSLGLDLSKNRELGYGKAITITSKASNEDKSDLSKTTPISAILPDAFGNFLTYTTGIGDIDNPNKALSRINAMNDAISIARDSVQVSQREVESISALDFALGINDAAGAFAYFKPLGGYFGVFDIQLSGGHIVSIDINKDFFYGAFREPMKVDGKPLPWQEQATASQKQAYADMQKWVKDNLADLQAKQDNYLKTKQTYNLPRLPDSVLLWSARYNAIYNIAHSYETGGVFYNAEPHGLNSPWFMSLSPWKLREVEDGAVSTDYANNVMKGVITKATEYKNRDFLFLRDNILQSFLELDASYLENARKTTLNEFNKFKGGIVVNNDKGIRYGNTTYINKADGSNTSWQKIVGGATIYDSETIDGVKYVLTLSSSSTNSDERARELKMSSDLKEAVGSKTDINASVSGSGASGQ